MMDKESLMPNDKAEPVEVKTTSEVVAGAALDGSKKAKPVKMKRVVVDVLPEVHKALKEYALANDTTIKKLMDKHVHRLIKKGKNVQT